MTTDDGSRISYFAKRAQTDGIVARLSGDVTLNLDEATVTADEAVVDSRSGVIRLSGDVRLKTR